MVDNDPIEGPLGTGPAADEEKRTLNALPPLSSLEDEHARARSLAAKVKELIEQKAALKQALHNERQAHEATKQELRLLGAKNEAKVVELRIYRESFEIMSNLAHAIVRKS